MKKHIFIYIFIFILGAISVLAYLEIQKASKLEAMIDPQEEINNEMEGEEESVPQNITQATQEVVKALEAKDFQKLEKLASSEGIFFGVGPRFDANGGYYNHNIAKATISEIPTNTEVRHRYTTDGKGEEINTTMYKYIYEYIYNRDYVSGDIEVNTTEFVSSNSVVTFIDEIGSRSYTTIWNEHPEFEMGDTQLILIFDEEDGEYKIRGILSHFWTI